MFNPEGLILTFYIIFVFHFYCLFLFLFLNYYYFCRVIASVIPVPFAGISPDSDIGTYLTKPPRAQQNVLFCTYQRTHWQGSERKSGPKLIQMAF